MKKNLKYIVMLIILFIAIYAVNDYYGYRDVYFFVLLCIGVICFIFLIIPYFLGKISIRKSTLNVDDIKKESQYFREILKDYSPACLSYIDNFKLNKNDIIATLLSLKLKNKIKFFSNKIMILDTNETGLSKTEKYILDSIEENKVKLYNLEKFKELTKEESLNKELIIDVRPKRKHSFLIFVILLAILIISAIFDIINYIYEDLTLVTFCALFIEGIFYSIYIFIIDQSLHYARIRTEKGNEINKKLEGLKQYIQKYSSLDTKNSQFVNIWDEYLIYSVIFKQNKKINKEIGNLVIIESEEISSIFKS